MTPPVRPSLVTDGPPGTLLFTGRMQPWSIGASLVRAAVSKGHEVSVVAEEGHVPSNEGAHRPAMAARRALRPSRRAQYNLAVCQAAARAEPLAVFVIKGDWIEPRAVRWLSARFPTFLVSLDDFFPETDNRCSIRVRAAANHYLGIFTSKDHNVDALQSSGQARVAHFNPGVDLLVHRPVWTRRAQQLWDACFVGTFEADRAHSLAQLNGLSLAVRGNGWPRRGPLAVADGPAVYLVEKAFVYASSGAGLSFLRKNHHDVITDRPFEIAALGVPLIAERSAAQQAIFPEGEAALYFDSVEELQAHIESALADVGAAAERTRHALEIVQRHSYAHRFDEFLDQIAVWGWSVGGSGGAS